NSSSTCATRSARSPRPTTCNGRRACRRRAAARSCVASCARSPRTLPSSSATPARSPIRRWWNRWCSSAACRSGITPSPHAGKALPLLPLAGEGRGGGALPLHRHTPTPTLPRTRGREQSFPSRACGLLLPPLAGEGRDGGLPHPRTICSNRPMTRALHLPITLAHAKGAYTVRLSIGSGQRPGNFVLDTGSSTLVVLPHAYDPDQDASQ